ncbi:MAG: GNAT family N-acetyltransferase [Dehalococcoidia bacterium]|nr:GNAT family N-acetyltransferase [Dehalococcoidia bacterium]
MAGGTSTGGRPEGSLEISVVTDQAAMDAALSVRFRVFVEEQHVPLEEEVDGYDANPGANPAVLHVLARLDGEPVATARLLLDQHDHGLHEAHSGYPHIGRVAVLAEHRQNGVGRRVMEALHAEARARGIAGITLSAQLHAVPFYERLGYTARGEVYLDAGIEHRDMDLPFE